jgi:hypothetical protein
MSNNSLAGSFARASSVRFGPCATIHMVLPLLGSGVAFLSLISVFGAVALGVH